MHFEQSGQPGKYDALMKQLEQGSLDARKATARKAKLPRIAFLDSDKSELPLALPPLDFNLPLRGTQTHSLLQSVNPSIRGVKAMAYHQGKLWLALVASERQGPITPGSSVEHELSPLDTEVTGLWCLDPDQGVLKRVDCPLAGFPVTSIASIGNELWLMSDQAQGFVAWNPATSQLRRFPAPQAIVAAAGGRVFAIDPMNVNSLLEQKTNKWRPLEVPALGIQQTEARNFRRLASSGDSLLFYNTGLLTLDLRSNAWTRWDQRISELSPLQDLGRVTSLAGDDRGSFWAASEMGLHFLDPQAGTVATHLVSLSTWMIPDIIPNLRSPFPSEVPTGTSSNLAYQMHTVMRENAIAGLRNYPEAKTHTRAELARFMARRKKLAEARKSNPATLNPYLPISRMPQPLAALACDGDYLWILTGDGRLFLFHQPSNRWVNGTRLGGKGAALAVGAGKVWVGIQAGAKVALYSFALKDWTTTPQSQWVSDEISPTDRSAAIEKWSARQQAVCRFFWGEPEATVKLLNPKSMEDFDTEALFLLSACYDECGLNQPAEAKRYRDELTIDHPDSIFAQYYLDLNLTSGAQHP
jgi:hypothetical protein